MGELNYSPDGDEDGFDLSEDCDDDNSTVFPGAGEICVGVDNNCDGEIDEGCAACVFQSDCPSWAVCEDGQCVIDDTRALQRAPTK